MKVLHFIHDLGMGGTQKTAEQFTVELMRRGHQCVVLFYTGGDEHRCHNLAAYAVEEGLTSKLMCRGISRDSKEAEFQEVVDEFKPDIIHTYSSGYSEFPDPGIHYDPKGAKCVQTNVFGHPNHNPKLHKVLYMSEYLQLLTGNKGDRYDFIYNPIPEPVTSSVRQEIVFEGNNEILIEDDKIVIGRTGRPENGIYDPISVDALGMILNDRPSLRERVTFLALAPPPNMIKDLRKYNIPFSMHLPTVTPYEIDRIYSMMDIFAHARLDGETCGCVIEEAMMHGLPVVTHKAQPNNPTIYPFQAQTTLVEHDRTGFVVEHSTEAYAGALEELIDDADLRLKLGKAGKEVAMTLFETGVCVDKLERIYMELLNGSKKD